MSGGRPLQPHAAAALGERGVVLADHVSRHLEPGMVGGADLIVGMAREHVREAVVLHPDALDRTVTLKELVRLADARPRRRPEDGLRAWLAGALAERDPMTLLGSSPDDDIDDPIGGPLSAYRATAEELDALLARVVATVWPGEHIG